MTLLPSPVDDGRAAHLRGARLPELALPATDGRQVNLGGRRGWWLLCCYTLTGRPGMPLPPAWGSTPGAHGSTPQSEGFRDHHAEFVALGVSVFGPSTQGTAWQREAAARLHLLFPLLRDTALRLQAAPDLPTFRAGSDQVFYSCLTLIINGRQIAHVLYPVFPPADNATQALTWVRAPGRLNT